MNLPTNDQENAKIEAAVSQSELIAALGATQMIDGVVTRFITPDEAYELVRTINKLREQNVQLHYKTEYRLLNNDDVIRSTDEMLLDDCMTWERVGDGPTIGEQWLNGQKYTTNLFVPMRRSYQPPNETG